MPEIAEVETIKNDLLISGILGQRIKSVDILFTSIIEIQKSLFTKKIKNKVISQISRKGKYLIFDLGKLYLIIHLKMTGHLLLKDKNYILKKHELISLTFKNNKKLIFYDPRRFGKIYLRKNLNITNKLGPDILSKEFIFTDFYNKLKIKRKKIKTFLLDQNFIAGIGNIYADEVLFLAKIHPEIIAKKINKEKAKILFNSIKKVIKKAVKNRGTSLGTSKLNFTSIKGDFGLNQNHLLVHTKKICPICSMKIEKIKINQRTSYFCKKCQKLTN